MYVFLKKQSETFSQISMGLLLTFEESNRISLVPSHIESVRVD